MTTEPLKKICFVIIGYGKKKDYRRGIEIDLDRTFEHIIEPVFTGLGFKCLRAADIDHSGSIDEIIYSNIYSADFVVADISTLNANVLYELGVRHGVKKNTTIIIADSTIDYPFDLSHISIEKYNHGGSYIDVKDAKDIQERLIKKTKELLKNQKTDSPLYHHLSNLNPPSLKPSVENPGQYASGERKESISDYLDSASKDIATKKYLSAIETLQKARKLNYEVSLVTQKLALATYKSQSPSPIESYKKAWEILSELSPDKSYDPETRGLAGAIFKGLFDLTKNNLFLRQSIEHYTAGFSIYENYYNGINIAFLLLQKALTDELADETIATYAQLISQRLKVKKICLKIMNHEGWHKRGKEDQIWVVLTLAEVFVGQENFKNEKICLDKAILLGASDFALETYENQKMKIIEYNELLRKKLNSMTD